MAMPEIAIEGHRLGFGGPGAATTAESRLGALVETLGRRLRKGDEKRRAMLHIVGDLNESNKHLANQRKAMLHILADYEEDRRRLSRQTERLDNSRRALLHLLQGSHKDKLRLEASRKAMIHIMGGLRETAAVMQRREQELRDKQEQLGQAGKLATLGELTSPPAFGPRHAAEGRAMNQPHVLIVDDDPALLQALPETLRLRMGGGTVDTADSGEAALDRVAAP